MAEKRAARKMRVTPKKNDPPPLERVRQICLSIPGTVEKISHGAPTFFTPKRVFAMFVNNHHGEGHVAVWLPTGPGVQRALIEEAPETYFRPPYVGPSGWVGVEVPRVDEDQLGALIREAFHIASAKSSASGSAKASRADSLRTRTARTTRRVTR